VSKCGGVQVMFGFIWRLGGSNAAARQYLGGRNLTIRCAFVRRRPGPALRTGNAPIMRPVIRMTQGAKGWHTVRMHFLAVWRQAR
jgi:hypothetical protein